MHGERLCLTGAEGERHGIGDMRPGGNAGAAGGRLRHLGGHRRRAARGNGQRADVAVRVAPAAAVAEAVSPAAGATSVAAVGPSMLSLVGRAAWGTVEPHAAVASRARARRMRFVAIDP